MIQYRGCSLFQHNSVNRKKKTAIVFYELLILQNSWFGNVWLGFTSLLEGKFFLKA